VSVQATVAGAGRDTTVDPLLRVADLAIEFPSPDGPSRVVEGVSLDIGRGETLGLVGESGSGKTLTAKAIMGLVPAPGRVTSGTITLAGQPLPPAGAGQWNAIRGKRIGMVFQDHMSSLDPTMTVGRHFREVLGRHEGLRGAAARARAEALLAAVGIPHPRERLRAYPHELSGGMGQRVMIALAISCGPDVLIADEPTTALDVTIQAQVLDLLAELSASSGMAVLLITHDMGVAAELCDRVAVMYAGEIVEVGELATVYEDAQMPYTRALLASLPQTHVDDGQRLLPTIPGAPPDRRPDTACAFAPRCAHAREVCEAVAPALLSRPGPAAHLARCHGTEEGGWITVG